MLVLNDQFFDQNYDQCLLVYYNPRGIVMVFGPSFDSFYHLKIIEKIGQQVLFDLTVGQSREAAISDVGQFLSWIVDYFAKHEDSCLEDVANSEVLHDWQISDLKRNLQIEADSFQTVKLALC